MKPNAFGLFPILHNADQDHLPELLRSISIAELTPILEQCFSEKQLNQIEAESLERLSNLIGRIAHKQLRAYA